jgi:hypothetical protein
VTDRYTRAIEQLGSDKLDVRIGGIYALERIARDSPRDHPTTMEVLAAFIREHSHEQWPKQAMQGAGRTTRPDVQAALTVIGRRALRHDSERVNLESAVLSRANLSGAKLGGANLARARLDYADLDRAYLFGANLNEADLTGARLARANLANAELTRADLTSADLDDADLEYADLYGAKLGGASISSKLSAVRWPSDMPVPPGWRLDTGTGRLWRAAGDSGDAAPE